MFVFQVRRDYLAWTPAEKDQKQDGVVIEPQHGISEHQTLAKTVHAPSTPPETDKEAAHEKSTTTTD